MNDFSDELRLALVLLLNGGLFVAPYRFARRWGVAGAVQAVCDAFLLYFLVQYAAVALPGIMGIFNAWTMSSVAIALGAGMWIASRQSTPTIDTARVDERATAPSRKPAGKSSPPGQRGKEPKTAPQILPSFRGNVPRDSQGTKWWNVDRLVLLACALFTAAYLGADAFHKRFLPPVATDPLVYHLPMAVQWIQTHRLGIYPTWYWNPAASYSPETGAIFMAWWMAPAGNDVFVRFLQLPPLMFVFFLVVRICRVMGCSRMVAGLLAVAATLAHPLFREATFQKDDLFITAFIAAALLALADRSMRDRFGPWRVGIALGFVLASKYTALLICPIFLFTIDAPFRARWKRRHWTIAITLMLAMALPWYLRNIMLTGNPLYPVDVNLLGFKLRGLFGVERDQSLRTASGIWKMLADNYFSLPVTMIVLLSACWIWTWIAAGRSVLRDPLPRACALGTAVTLLIFLVASPHHEVRYLFPLIVLWFAAAGLGLARGFQKPVLQIAPAALLAAITIGTTLEIDFVSEMAGLAAVALLIALLGVGGVILHARFVHLKRRHLAVLGAAAVMSLAMYAFVNWHAYVEDCRQARSIAWATPTGYPLEAGLWKWVDENVPADATIAYADTFFVYPYYGFNFTRHVGYAPIRKGLQDFADFPRMGDRVPGDLIVHRMTEVMDENPDRATWLQNLRQMNAGYLVVLTKHESDGLDPNPPELKFAEDEKGKKMFIPVYSDEAGVVFRIDWNSYVARAARP